MSEISDKEISQYYEKQGKSGDHQKLMYFSRDPLLHWFQNNRKRVVLSAIDKYRPTSLLDVGCAEGLYTRYKSHQRKYSVGIDISKPKIIRANKLNKVKNVKFFQADASQKLPFPDNHFDMVICVDTIRCVKKPMIAIKELFRVSKRYVVIQSGTNPTLLFLNQFIKRSSSVIKNEFKNSIFSGFIWTVPPRSLGKLSIRIPGKPKVISQSGLFPIFYSIISRINKLINISRNKVLIKYTFPILDKLYLVLAYGLFKNLGYFTTVVFEKTTLKK